MKLCDSFDGKKFCALPISHLDIKVRSPSLCVFTRCPCELVFIINGDETEVNADPDAPLSVACITAREQTGYNSGAEREWEVRLDTGELVPQDVTPAALGLMLGARLFLTLRVAAGGSV